MGTGHDSPVRSIHDKVNWATDPESRQDSGSYTGSWRVFRQAVASNQMAVQIPRLGWKGSAHTSQSKAPHY